MNRARFSRRESIKVAAGAGLGILGHSSISQAAEEVKSDGLEVNIAGYSYDRVRAIQDGRLGLDGFDVSFHVEDIYHLNENCQQI